MTITVTVSHLCERCGTTTFHPPHEQAHCPVCGAMTEPELVALR